jgi:iron complex transport system permease protein
VGTATVRVRSFRRELITGLIVLSIITAGIVIAATLVGAATIPWSNLLEDQGGRVVLLKIRLPRVLLAAIVGAALAVSGLTFQNLLRNPLADPFILGVSGGAACGAAIATAMGMARFPGVVPLVAFGGACLATGAVFVIARRNGRAEPLRLILAGLVLNSLFTALILLSLAVTRGSDLTAALRWMMGSLFSATWTDVMILATVLLGALGILAWYGNDIRMLVFGEEDARSRGVHVARVKLIAYIVASVATGATVAVSGIIGFIGLMVPHAARLIWRSDFRLLLPLCALGGAALLTAADACARTVVAPQELPLGALTALLGVPFFLSVLRRASGP